MRKKMCEEARPSSCRGGSSLLSGLMHSGRQKRICSNCYMPSAASWKQPRDARHAAGWCPHRRATHASCCADVALCSGLAGALELESTAEQGHTARQAP